MKNTIAEQLFCGEYNILEKEIDRKSDYGKANHASAEIVEEFAKLIPENNQKKFDELLSAESELVYCSNIDSFEHGLKLGIQIMMLAMD